MMMSRKQLITGFVKQTLGCRCPDKVFEKVESGVMEPGGFAGGATRIVVGDTLLVYIVVAGGDRHLYDHIAALAESGRRDRDSHGYNRFRLVVADEAGSREHEKAAAAFAGAAGSDEKMHIHFVAPDAVSGL